MIIEITEEEAGWLTDILNHIFKEYACDETSKRFLESMLTRLEVKEEAE